MSDVLTAAEALPPPPDAIPRPALALFLWERGIEYRDAGAAIGVSGTSVYLYCLPFADPRRATPRKAVAERIATWSRGVVPPDSFTAPSEGLPS